MSQIQCPLSGNPPWPLACARGRGSRRAGFSEELWSTCVLGFPLQTKCLCVHPSPPLSRPLTSPYSLTLHPHVAPRYPGVSAHTVAKGVLGMPSQGPGLCQARRQAAHPLSCHYLQLRRLLGPRQEAVTWSSGWPQRREPKQVLGKDREAGAGRERKGSYKWRQGRPCGPSPICL